MIASRFCSKVNLMNGSNDFIVTEWRCCYETGCLQYKAV